MKITVHICPSCGDKIFSRCRHDFHYCGCDSISIDGGFDYVRFGWKDHINYKEVKTEVIELDVTKEELYADWSYMKDEYGIIKKEV